MLAASRALIVHYIELLVKKGVECKLSCFQSLLHMLKHLLIHVIDHPFILWYLEELSQLFLRLAVWIKVHLSRLLQLLPSLEFFISPILWLF